MLGKGAFQEIDLQGAFGDVAASPDRAPRLTTPSWRARRGHAVLERGVAHLVFPDEVQVLPAPGAEPAAPEGRAADLPIAPPAERSRGGRAALRGPAAGDHRRHRRPRAARADVIALAERLGAPVMTTFRAKGLIPDYHPLACGVLGRRRAGASRE